MATKNRKKRTTTKRKVSKAKVKETNAFVKVVGTIIALFFAIFVALSNFSLCGSIGEIVRSIVLSLFGFIGYFSPIVIIISILFNLVYDKKVASAKTYALILLYIMIICLLDIYIIVERTDLLFDAINETIIKARNYTSFSDNQFSSGILVTAITYVSIKAIGEVGSLALFWTIAIICFLGLFGLGVTKYIWKLIKSIFLFIPNIIEKSKIKKEEDLLIAIDNENILKSTIEKSKQANMRVTFDDSVDKNRLVLEPYREPVKRKYDTSNINISADDIQSRFYSPDYKEDSRPQEHLLKEMKKKSINEILYEEKEKGKISSSFFYTEGMKPIDELTNINFPRNYDTNNKIADVNLDEEKDVVNNDNNQFASGLSEFQNDTRVKDSKEFLSNIKNEKVEVKNNNLKDEILIDSKSRKRKPKKYKFPPTSLLSRSDRRKNVEDPNLKEKAEVLVETLRQFGVGVSVTNITVGPSVTRFELKPDIGVKIAKILSLENDIKLALAASEIRIEAPIPGKSAIGVEVRNKNSMGVLLGDIISSSEFRNSPSKLTVAIGKDISGKVIVTDLRKMPHLLIAGSTGSGKSVCINSLITSLIYKSSPEDVRLILVDPKLVELQVYDGIPHLLIPVVTDPKKAAGALNWAVSEMTRRYNLIQEKRVRDIESYNQAIEGEIKKIGINDNNEADYEPVAKLPYIVIIIDEFADLMMVASKDVENSIMRIAQLARACGIYLVIATQRPTVNIISGSIKTNVPSRISFAVASGTDSQTILDRRGAEKLLGHGDMLYFPSGIPEPIRVQGCYVSEEEILETVNYVKDDGVIYDENAENAIEKGVSSSSSNAGDSNERDDLFIEAATLVIEKQNASIGLLQRKFAIGFNRAARIMDQLESFGVVSIQEGKKPREVLMTKEEFDLKIGG